jgi:NAD(P)-dependent dehydrogenase (short-subunit alcohol dehydrogenase family)
VSAPGAGRPVALVTGGARRVGAAIVERLAGAGHAVAIHCGTSRAQAEALAARLRADGAVAVVLQADLADAGACTRLVSEACAALGPLALLVNNASTFDRDRLDTLDPAVWDRQFAVNIRAPALLASAFARHAGGPDPSIVNIVDQRVRRLTPQVFSYTLTKAALHAATTTMAQSLAPRIRVNAVAPGPTLANVHDGEAGMMREAAGVPLQRAVPPGDIADAVLYLAGARSVTGQTLYVDAGQSIGWRTPDIIDDTQP